MGNYLGIDVGSITTKLVVLSESDEVLASPISGTVAGLLRPSSKDGGNTGRNWEKPLLLLEWLRPAVPGIWLLI